MPTPTPTRFFTRAALAGASLALTLAYAPSSFAGDVAAAESLFEAGQRLMKARDYAKACPKFAASFKEDPSVGAMLNLARCHQLQGKTASAWGEYKTAATLARKEGQAEREEGARKFAKQLEGKLSKLTINVTSPVEGMVVTRNDTTVRPEAFGVPIAVDPDRYTVIAKAPGHKPHRIIVSMPQGPVSKAIEIPALKPGEAELPPEVPEPSTGPSAQFVVGGVSLGLGVAGLLAGIATGAVASSQLSDIEETYNCTDSVCETPGVQDAIAADVDPMATASTIGFIAGGVLAATGVILLATAPSADDGDKPTDAAIRVVPTLAPGRDATGFRGVGFAGLSVSGAF